MAKSLISKLKLVLAVIMVFAISMSVGLFGVSAKAEDTFSLDAITYEMEGASIRIGERDGKNGLKFSARMSQEDYELINANVGEGKEFVSVEYGVLIAPKYYTEKYPFNADTVFGASSISKKVYDWAILGETDWEYSGTNSLPAEGGTGVRIINIYTNDWTEGDDGYTYSGAIVDIKDGVVAEVNNLAEEMFSNAYIKATKADGTVEYRFTTNGISMSAAYVAQKTIEEGILTAEQNQWLIDNYIELAKHYKDYTYTVEHNYVTASGEIICAESEKVVAELDSIVSVEPKEFEGYAYDANYEGTLLSGKVYANNGLTLKLFYVSNTRGGLLDKNEISYIYPSKLLSAPATDKSAIKLYRMAGEYPVKTTTDDSGVVWTVMSDEYTFETVAYTPDANGAISMANLDGTYKLVIGHNESITVGGTAKTIFAIEDSVDFDVYDSTEEFVWSKSDVIIRDDANTAKRWALQGLSRYTWNWGVSWKLVEKSGADLPEGAKGDSYYFGSTNRMNGESNLTYDKHAYYIKPLHSLEYFKKLADLDVALYYDYYIGTDNVTIGGTATDYTTAKVTTVSKTEQTVALNTWHTVELKIADIIANWQYISTVTQNDSGNAPLGSLLRVDSLADDRAPKEDQVPLNVYLGNFRFGSSFVDEEVHMIEISSASQKFDVTDIMSPEAKAEVQRLVNAGGVAKYTITDSWGTVEDLSASTIITTNANHQKYFELLVTVDGFEVYKGSFDVYNPSTAFVFVPMGRSYNSQLSLVGYYATYSGGKTDSLDLTTSFSTSAVGGVRNVIKLSSALTSKGTEPSEKFFSLVPTHSKEYYERYAGSNVSIDLSLYIQAPSSAASYDYVVNQFAFYNKNGTTTTGGTYGASTINTWITKTISLNTILENWDTIFSATETEYSWANRPGLNMIHIYNNTSFATTGTAIYFNVATTVDPTGVVIDDTATQEMLDVANVENASAFNLYDAMLSQEQKESISVVSNSISSMTYKLVSEFGKIEVVLDDATAVDLTAIENVNYKFIIEATSKLDGTVWNIYTGKVDIFNSTEAPAWVKMEDGYESYVVLHNQRHYNDMDKTPILVDQRLDFVNGWFEATFTGRGVNFDNVMTVLPIHSKEYYQDLADLGLTLRFYFTPKLVDGTAYKGEYRVMGEADRRPHSGGISAVADPNTSHATIDINFATLFANWDLYTSQYPNTKSYEAYDYLIRDIDSVWTTVTTDVIYCLSGFEFVLPTIEGVEDTELKLIDVVNTTSVDLFGEISEDGKALINKWARYGVTYTLTDAAGKVIELGNSSIISTVQANLKAYTLKAYVAGQLVYTGSIDLYDSTKAPVWNTVDTDGLAYVKSYKKGYSATTNTAVTDNASIAQIDGADYIKTTFTSITGGQEVYSTIYALHSKEYYEQMLGGYGYVLSFDFYFSYNYVEGKSDTTDFHWFGLTGVWRVGERDQKVDTTTRMSKKYNITISLDDLIAHWDEYNGAGPKHNHHSTGVVPYDYLISLCGQAQAVARDEKSMFIGNLKLIPTGTIDAITDETTRLVDVNGKSTFDLANAINDEGKALLSKYPGMATYTITDMAGNVLDLGANSVIDTTVKANLKGYTLTVKVGESLAYTGYVDLYDSADAFEFNSVYKTDLSFVKLYEGSAKDRGEVTFADGLLSASFATPRDGANDKVLKILPQHSKAFYEMHLGDGVNLEFDFYHVMGDGSNTSLSTCYRRFGHSGERTNIASGANNKIHVKYSLDDIVANWDAYIAPNGNDGTYGMLIRDVGWTWTGAANKVDIDFFIDNFKTTITPTITPVVDETIFLEDVTGQETLAVKPFIINMSVKNYIEKCKTLGATYTLTNVSGEVFDLGADGYFDIDGKYGQYTINGIVGSTVVYTGYIDIYSTEEDLVWNDATNVNAMLSLADNHTSTKKINASAVQFDDKDAMLIENYSGHGYFTLLPIHSKGYYARFLNQGYKISYSVYLSTADGGNYNQLFIYSKTTTALSGAANANVWKSKSVSLDTVVSEWDYFVNGKCGADVTGASCWNSRAWSNMFHVYNAVSGLDIYFSGVTVSQDISTIKVVETVDVDVKEDSKLNINEYISAKGQTVIDYAASIGEQITYSYKAPNGDVLTETSFDARLPEKHGAYKVIVYAGEIDIYTLTLNVTNSDFEKLVAETTTTVDFGSVDSFTVSTMYSADKKAAITRVGKYLSVKYVLVDSEGVETELAGGKILPAGKTNLGDYTVKVVAGDYVLYESAVVIKHSSYDTCDNTGFVWMTNIATATDKTVFNLTTKINASTASRIRQIAKSDASTTATLYDGSNRVVATYPVTIDNITTGWNAQFKNLLVELDDPADLRYYKLVITASETDLLVIEYDLYDSTVDPIWNVVSEDNLGFAHSFKVNSWDSYNMQYTPVDVKAVLNGFFELAFTESGNSKDNAIKILPLHSKEYYERLEGLGYSLNFTYYYNTPVEGAKGTTSYRVFGDSGRPDSKVDQQINASISLDLLLQKWDVYMSDAIERDDGENLRLNFNFLIKMLGWTWSDNHAATNMYVGNFSLTTTGEFKAIEDKTLYSKSVTVGSSFSFDSLIDGEDTKKYIDGYLNSGAGVTYSITDVNGTTIDLGATSTVKLDDSFLRQWTFNIYHAGKVLYTGYCDLYDLERPLVWNEVTNANSMRRWNSSHVEQTNVNMVATSFDGKDVLKYAAKEQQHPYFSMKPLHDKSYYEKYVGLGYTFTYSLYADTTTNGGSFNQISLQNRGSSASTGADVWHTKTITLDDIVTYWDYIVDGKCATAWTGKDCWGSRFYTAMAYMYNVKNVDIYLAGFTFSASLANAIKGEETIYNLDASTTIDFTAKIGDKNMSVINTVAAGTTLTGKLVPVYGAGEIEVANVKSFDASAVEKRAYNLTIYANDVAVYTAVVDFYSEADGVIWATELTEENVFAYSKAFVNGWGGGAMTKLVLGTDYNIVDASTVSDETSPLFGKTGKFIVWTAPEKIDFILTVAPLHSKTYYAEFLGNKDYVLSADAFGTGSFAGVAMDGYRGKEMRYGSYTSWRTSMDHNNWFTFNWSFDNYLIPSASGQNFFASEHYLNFANIGKSHDEMYNMISFEASTAGSTVYFGLPYVDSFAEVVYLNTNNMEVDVNQSSSYDLTKLLNNNQKAKYNYYVTKYGYDAIYWKVTFADDSVIYIWANQDGTANLDFTAKAGETAEGASITVAEKLALGVIRTTAFTCDIPTFAPSQPVKGIYGQVNGANNNQQIVIIGSSTKNNDGSITLKGITFTNLPAQTEVIEIAVADGTTKFMREQGFTAQAQTVGDINAIYTNSTAVGNSALTYKAFKNEYENAQIQIVSAVDLGEYRLELADLVSGENVLAASNFTVYHQLYTHLALVAGGTVNPTGVGDYPDALLPMNVALANDVAGLKAGINQGVWITLYVPGDQEAGEYTGTFRLILGNSVYEIAVAVTVYDYEVSDDTMMQTSLSLNYSDIVNLETPYEYDDEGKIVVNSSGNKAGTVSEELRKAYIQYFSSHRISTSPVVSSTTFSGSWQGYPYDPHALFSFEVIGTKADGSPLYSYERPLRNKNANGETYVVTSSISKPGCDVTYGYPIYNDRVDAYFAQIVEFAQDPGVTNYRIPVNQATVSNFNYANINELFSYWPGSLFEIRGEGENAEMPDGERAATINQIVLRDVIEKFFLKAMELHKAGNSVDVFAKASVFPTWIDEFAINESKTFNAKYLLKFMKDFFPNCAEWLAKVYEDEIAGDEFLLGMIESISNIKINVTADTIRDLDPNEHYANFVLTPSEYNSEAGRDAIDNWANIAYNGEAEKWVYIGGNVHPSASLNVEAPLLSSRMMAWMMSEYDIEGFLYWATMRSKYEDGINSSVVESVIGKTVKDGQIIELEDFYNNAIHYSSTGGDGFLVYPGSYFNVTGPVGTIRVESLRDGIEDYNLFYDLKEMYKEAGLEESYYNVMRRLSEMLYTGTNVKTPNGYIDDFMMARESLANMLILARDSKVYVDDVYMDGENCFFTVVAPSDIAEAVKGGTSAGFVSETDVTVNGIAGKKMVFGVTAEMLSAGYVTIAYNGNTINLSIETLVETAEVEALGWTNVSSNSVYTAHSSNQAYSQADSSKVANVSVVSLTEENAVGGRTNGDYFYVAPVNANSTANLGFAVLPTEIDKATVDAYVGKAKLVFDVYMVNTYLADGSLRNGQKVFYKLGKSTNSSTRTNEWFSVSIDFAQISENWDTLNANTTMTYENWSTSYRALFAVNLSSHSAAGSHTTSFYIGNFRIAHV